MIQQSTHSCPFLRSRPTPITPCFGSETGYHLSCGRRTLPPIRPYQDEIHQMRCSGPVWNHGLPARGRVGYFTRLRRRRRTRSRRKTWATRPITRPLTMPGRLIRSREGVGEDSTVGIPPKADDGGGCGCHASSRGPTRHATPGLLLMLLLTVLRVCGYRRGMQSD